MSNEDTDKPKKEEAERKHGQDKYTSSTTEGRWGGQVLNLVIFVIESFITRAEKEIRKSTTKTLNSERRFPAAHHAEKRNRVLPEYFYIISV